MYGFMLGGLALLMGFLFTIGKWTYEYFKDPKGLRRYPAMTPLAGITNLPAIILSYGGFRSKHLYELHKSGMPVVRTGPNSLSYSDVRAIKDIYGHSTKCTKDGNYVVQAGTHYHLADVVDKGEHARKRKVLSSAFAIKNLEEWEFKVADKLERLVAQFDKRCSTDEETVVIDYRPWTNYFTLDAIADIGLSHMLHFLDNGNDRTTTIRPDGTTYEVNFRECLYANSRATSVLGFSYDYYPWLCKLSKLSPSFSRLWQLDEGWSGIAPYLAQQRLKRYQAGEKLDDFFEALMHDKNSVDHNLEWGEIVAEINIMMNAGSTTTAISMANVMYQMCKQPKIMETLRREIDDVIDDDEDITPYDKVKYLPYLRACLDESLRMFPPISHGLTRETPEEGAIIAGDFIPGGTSVAVSSFVAHRDPNIFPDPDTYNPDRWLGESGKNLGPYFITFSAGARGCIGRNIAYLEQTVLLATMLHRYDIEFAKPGFEPGRYEWQNLHLTELPIKIRRRHQPSSRATT
ncbi:cytochrome P450 [Polychaeton citri CBS 116435]|uniref:Cytochrome P450 n=1 Tax=Polychaeton citri CBS 116435 TaxID=1314669 RepID=A0A9P4Q7W9_9PEZI|nr:cytochrome P450 [Polychaeton citri CBS 116435]